MKLLVTGGYGFIGSHFIKHLLNSSYEIVNYDKVTYAANPENLRDVGCLSIKGDINNIEIDLSDFDGIVNFAAESHVDNSINDSSPFIKTNILGVSNLLEQARRNDLFFLQVSTDEVYGSLKEGFADEKFNLKPNNPYSASKASADLLVRSYHKTYGLKTLITRSTNNYGPNQNTEKFIPLFITNILQGKKTPLYGKGDNYRDWIYVEDNVNAIKTVVEKGKSGEIYNIASGNLLSNIDVARKIHDLLDSSYDNIEYVKDRQGHDFRYALSCSKLNDLGWSPSISFDEGIKKTINWYKENEWWYT